MKNLKLQELFLDSREVAEMMEKNHAHLLRDINTYAKYLTESKIGLSDFFLKSQYKDASGKTNKNYQITRKGCEFLAHKLTGKKGAIFTATYINKFHEMERALKEPKRKEIEVEEPREIVPKFYRGAKVMTFDDLAVLSGQSKGSAYWQVKNILPNYTILRNEELALFKKTNGVYPMAKSLAVLYRDEAVSFCEYVGIDPSDVYSYFAEEEPKKTQEPDLYRAELLSRVIPYLGETYGRYLAERVVLMVMGDKILKDFELALSRMEIKRELLKMGAKGFNEFKRIRETSPEYRALSPKVKGYMDQIFSEVEKQMI